MTIIIRINTSFQCNHYRITVSRLFQLLCIRLTFFPFSITTIHVRDLLIKKTTTSQELLSIPHPFLIYWCLTGDCASVNITFYWILNWRIFELNVSKRCLSHWIFALQHPQISMNLQKKPPIQRDLINFCRIQFIYNQNSGTYKTSMRQKQWNFQNTLQIAEFAQIVERSFEQANKHIKNNK